jgi:RHS repeat-associated protein
LQYLLTVWQLLMMAVKLVSSSHLPFGEPRLAADAPTDFGYTGQRSLAAAGLMDYNARWYDAALGRFVSADSLVPGAGNPQALNRYSYVNNIPISFTDPSGNKPCDEQWGCYASVFASTMTKTVSFVPTIEDELEILKKDWVKARKNKPALPLIEPVTVTDPYGAPRYDDAGNPIGGGHQGIDLWNYDQQIFTVFSGTVVSFLGQDIDPFGNSLVIETNFWMLPDSVITALGVKPGQSVYVLYAHMKEPPTVDLGAEVTRGQTIGKMGNTGTVFGSGGGTHLHLEARVGPSGAIFGPISKQQGVRSKGYADWFWGGFGLVNPTDFLPFP